MGLFGRGNHAAIEEVEIPALDLDRTKYRLDGIAHYGSIAALLMNAALVVLSAVPKRFDERKTENMVKVAGASLVSATVVFGAYTAMVFSLMGLYSKTILGMGKDNEFLDFFGKTNTVRDSAFFSFVGAIICFNLSFIATLYLHTEGKTRVYLTAGALALFGACAQNWIFIMNTAADLLPHSQYGFCA